MNKIVLFITLMLGTTSFAQTPQGINYQAVAYDANGFELANQEISVRLGILLETADAESSYTETHQITTNDFGLFSLVISDGTTTDNFSVLNWENGAFLKIELDANLDGNYTLIGINSFSSVPYALYAPLDNTVDSLISLFEYKFELMNRSLQESLDLGVTIEQLYTVGFEMSDFIGLIYQGGLILYVDETGERGLVAAIEDLEGTYEWGCYEINVNAAIDTIIGTGYQNTIDIISQGCLTDNGGLTAAHAASSFEFDGFTDWYLPSLLELYLMYNTIGFGSLNNIGGFNGSNYWSSSSKNAYGARHIDFTEGYSTSSRGKNQFFYVRPMRAFGNWTMGCIDNISGNYNSMANQDDGSCIPTEACPYPEYLEYDSTAASYSEVLCQTPVVYGCTYGSALNYQSNANTDDGSCIVSHISPSQGSNGDVLSVSMSGSIYDQYSQTTTNSVIRFSQYSSTNSFFGSLLEFNLLNSLYSYNYEALVELFIPEDQEVGTYTIEMGSSENSYNWTMLEHNFEIVPAPYGCTQQELADGSCVYYGCTDSTAYNYDETATTDDESCLVGGCMNPTAENYNADADTDDESCIIYGCTLSVFPNYNSNATVGDGSCDMSSTDVFGCTDESTWTYHDLATIDNGSCNYSEPEVGGLGLGGMVFYVDESGENGLVAATEDLVGYYSWGCNHESISGANGQAIGTGYQNSLDVVAGCSETPIAASVALGTNLNGYTDWYLPSKYELIEMYYTIGNGNPEGNIGGFQNSSYWSSSEDDNSSAWYVYFYNGDADGNDKHDTRRVRVIRAFGYTQGCKDETACNYDESVDMSNGTCDFPEIGYDCFGDSVYVDSLNVIECPDEIEFSYQEDIDSFQNNYSSCTSLGYVYIYGEEIDDLTFLANISSINDLHIDNTSISSLDGLESLVSLNYFNFEGNEALSDISALSNLNQTPEGFYIGSNLQLNNCDVLYDLYGTGNLINEIGWVSGNGSYCSNEYFDSNNINAACPYPEYLEYDSTAVNFSEEVCQIIAVYGCTDESALNYNYQANSDDESCEHIYGCTQQVADNYNAEATTDDESCIYYGCTNQEAGNYDETANTDDGTCLIGGCTNATAENYNTEAVINDNTCIIYGCTLSSFPNYNSVASIGDGTCDMSSTDLYGCTDATTWTYNPHATIDNGLCSDILEIGSLGLGGIVFYIDESGEHGFVAALEDIEGSNMDGYGASEGFQWGCTNDSVMDADGIDIGTGSQNTLDIITQTCQTENGGITAAQATLYYSSEGFTDWFLPSRYELIEMYYTIGNGGLQGNVGGFEMSDYSCYWSSSRKHMSEAYGLEFNNGSQCEGYTSYFLRVRAVRAF